MISKFIKGMVYWAVLPAIDSELKEPKNRPVVVVSNNSANLFSANITIVPCTSKIDEKPNLPTHVVTHIYKDESVILCENIQTISKKRLNGFIGILDENVIQDIDQAIKIALDLDMDPSRSSAKIPPLAEKRDNNVVEDGLNAVKDKSTVQSRKFLFTKEQENAFKEDMKTLKSKQLAEKYGITVNQVYNKRYYYNLQEKLKRK